MQKATGDLCTLHVLKMTLSNSENDKDEGKKGKQKEKQKPGTRSEPYIDPLHQNFTKRGRERDKKIRWKDKQAHTPIDCADHIARGVTLSIPFRKSGTYLLKRFTNYADFSSF